MTKKANHYLIRKGVTVVRDGKRIRPELNKDFALTDAEAKSIREADPTALGAASGDEGSAETASVEQAPGSTPGSSSAPSSAEASQTAAKGGRKTATANVSDAEAAAGKKAGDDADKSGDDDL